MRDQVRIKKTNANEPLMKYRNVKDDTKNRCDVKRNGNCIKKMSKGNYLFICLYGVRYYDLSGRELYSGSYLEQGNAVCRYKRETASKGLTSQLSMRHTVAD